MTTRNAAIGVLIGGAVGPSLGSAFRTVTEQSQRMSDSLRRSRIGEMVSKDLIKYHKELDTLTRLQKTTGLATEGMASKIAKAEGSYRRAEKRAGEYGVTIGNVARRQRQFELAAIDSERALERLNTRERNRSRMGSVRSNILGLAAGGYAVGRAMRGPLEFERASTRLETVINAKDTTTAMQEAKQHALNFAKKNITNETEMLNIQYALNSAGMTAAASRIGSEIVAKTSVVTDGVPERVAEVVATTFNNLGGSLEGTMQDRLGRIGDLLTKTQFKFQIRDFNQLGESMKTAAPSLAQYNVELAQGLTILGQLNNAGMQGSEAGTVLKATMRNLSQASDELGFEMVRNSKGGLDLVETFKAMENAIGGFTDMDQETMDELQKIFGDEGIGGVVLLGQKLQELEAAQIDVAQSSRNIVDTSYAKFLDDTGGQLQILKNNFAQLSNTVMETFMPAITASIGPITEVIGNVATMIRQNPELGQTILGVAAGFLLLKGFSTIGMLGLVAMSSTATTLGAAFSVLKGGIHLVASAIGFLARRLLFSPIGLAVTAIALGAAYLVSQWEPARNFFMSFWEPIKQVWNQAIGWITKAYETVAKPIGMLFDKVVGAVDPDGSMQRKFEDFFKFDEGEKTKPAANNVEMKNEMNFTINAAPGADAREISDNIAKELEKVMEKARLDWALATNG